MRARNLMIAGLGSVVLCLAVSSASVRGADPVIQVVPAVQTAAPGADIEATTVGWGHRHGRHYGYYGGWGHRGWGHGGWGHGGWGRPYYGYSVGYRPYYSSYGWYGGYRPYGYGWHGYRHAYYGGYGYQPYAYSSYYQPYAYSHYAAYQPVYAYSAPAVVTYQPYSYGYANAPSYYYPSRSTYSYGPRVYGYAGYGYGGVYW